MNDLELVGDFNDLDWNVVDFKHPDWSWGFGLRDSVGEIRHVFDDEVNKRFIVTRYEIPKSLASIVVESRRGAVHAVKDGLLKLRQQEVYILTREEY